MRLVEDAPFNTEALKFSVKRLNQLGYFKALEGGKDVDVQKTPGETNKVDVKLKLEEQNRNQLTFGAGGLGVRKGSSASCRSRPRTSSAAARA